MLLRNLKFKKKKLAENSHQSAAARWLAVQSHFRKKQVFEAFFHLLIIIFGLACSYHGLWVSLLLLPICATPNFFVWGRGAHM